MRRAIGLFLIFLMGQLLFAQDDENKEIDQEIDIEELRERISGEAPNKLMGFNLGDADVSLSLTGFWYGSLQGNLGFFNSPLGIGFTSPDTPLLFQQEVDLTASLWINDRWFVEANFTDESAFNTYRAGYQGKAGEFVQYAGIGNTGLDFPSFAYLDLGGDTPSSLGFYGRFQTDNLTIHSLVRYDAAERQERTFLGGMERTYTDVELHNTVRGISFVLPDINIESDITIYIEDEKGSVLDSSGRKWRIVQASEYAFSRMQGVVELNIRPAGMIAVIYEKNGISPWQNSTGSYINNVQAWFKNINLSQYPQSGEVFFNGRAALVIYQPGTFSPFERQSRYDAPSSMSQSADIVRISTGNKVSDYEIIMVDNNALQAPDDLFPASFNQRRIFELIRVNKTGNPQNGSSIRDPQNLWPLADEYPEIYLPPKNIFTGDLTMRFININNTSGYFIGSDVMEDSIQVWRSGIQDSNFSYSQSTGEVVISNTAGQNELIRITFLKAGESSRTGSIAAGVGAVYGKPSNPFSFQTAVGILWNLTDNSYTEGEESNMGTIGVSAKALWNYDYLKAHTAVGFNFVQTDTTGLYRAAGMEGNETILSMPVDSSFISNLPVIQENDPFYDPQTSANRADLIYRNYYNNSVLGSQLMTIGWNAPVVSGINRPYPVMDSSIKTQIIAAEFELDNIFTWTGFQVPLVNYSELFSYAQEIEIPFKLYDIDNNELNNLRLIIQIGSLSGSNFSFTENPNLVWEQILVPDATQNYTIARFKLGNEDRLRLGNASFLRIIVQSKGNGGISGRFLLAPPIIKGASFRAVTLEKQNVMGNSANVSAVEIMEERGITEPEFAGIVKRFHTNLNTQRVLKIEWENMQEGISAGIDGRTENLPLSDYRQLSFFIKLNDDNFIDSETLSFYVTSGPEELNKYRLKAEFPLSAVKSKKWSKITIRYHKGNEEILIDGEKIHGADVSYNPLINNSSYLGIFFNPSDELNTLNSKTVFIDEIILEDPVSIYRINAGASAEYSKPGVIASAGNIPVLADFYVSSAVETETSIIENSDDPQTSVTVINRNEIGVSLFDVKIKGNFAFTSAKYSASSIADDDLFIWSAGHSVSRQIGPFFISESFNASPDENTVLHNINFSLSTDFFLSFNAEANYDFSKLSQKWNLGTGYKPKNIYIPQISFNTEANWQNNYQFDENKNYGQLWAESFKPLIPDLGENAGARRTNSQIIITQRTKPLGAVLGFEGSSNFTQLNNITRSESAAWLEIPVIFNRFNFNVKTSRSFKRHLYYSGDDAIDDGEKFFESINDSLYFWEVFPFYSLFAPQMNRAMDKSLAASPSSEDIFYSAFIDHFSTRINFPSVFNLTAFLIPSGLSFTMERAVEQKMDTRADSLNLNGGINFSALNMFGVMGYAPLFKFYQSDEFRHSIDTNVNIPRGEDITWRFQSVLNASFRGFSGGSLNFLNSLLLRSDDYWTESFTVFWESPSENSILSVFYNWIVSNAEKQNSWLYTSPVLNSKYEQLRKVSIESVFDNSSDYLRWNIMAGYEEIIRILGRLNFTTFIKLRFNQDDYSDMFIFDVLLGTTLRIIF